MKGKQDVKDLRSFLREVEERYPEELVRIPREVDIRFEISAILVRLDRAEFPIEEAKKIVRPSPILLVK